MHMISHHVIPDPKGGWNVKKVGASRASVHTSTKTEAINKGRIISANQKSELVVHNKDGRISSKDSHGNDPFPPRGWWRYIMRVTITYGWKNKKGTSNRTTCRCGSWKAHWENYSGSRIWPNSCCVYGCNKPATDGGHVMNYYMSGEWILPMCGAHNNPNNNYLFMVKFGSYIASANRSETCD